VQLSQRASQNSVKLCRPRVKRRIKYSRKNMAVCLIWKCICMCDTVKSSTLSYIACYGLSLWWKRYRFRSHEKNSELSFSWNLSFIYLQNIFWRHDWSSQLCTYNYDLSYIHIYYEPRYSNIVLSFRAILGCYCIL